MSEIKTKKKRSGNIRNIDNGKKKKKLSKKKKVLIGVLSLFVVLIGSITGLIIHKFSKIDIVKIDKADLGIEENYLKDLSNENNIKLDEVKQIKNVLLLGSDSRSVNMSAGRTDAMIVASINPVKKSIKLISIPRDTYVDVEGHGKTKLNHAYAYGKEQLLIKTINQNFDLGISEFVTINFSGLIKIIDSIGGIEVEISEAERSHINAYSQSEYATWKKRYKFVQSAGKVTLDGVQALTYSRDRENGSDFERANRQRKVITILLEKISSMDIGRINNIMDIALKEVKTNVKVTEYMGLVPGIIANRNDYMSNIHSAQLPSTEHGAGQKINGIYYFVADMEITKNQFKEYIYEK